MSDIYDEPFSSGGLKELMNISKTDISKTDNIGDTRYLYTLIPSLNSKATYYQLLIFLIVFVCYMTGIIYASSYNNNYTPNIWMFFKLLINNPSVSRNKFNEYIESIVEKKMLDKNCNVSTSTISGFTTNENSENSENNENIDHQIVPYKCTIFGKLCHWLNRIIINIFYVKGDTIKL